MNVKSFSGEEIRKKRQERCLTIEQLALITGIEVSQLGKLERGDQAITIKSGKKIAEALSIWINEIFEH